jgi:CubicO group peptidase (beta-lactamase class C family)
MTPITLRIHCVQAQILRAFLFAGLSMSTLLAAPAAGAASPISDTELSRYADELLTATYPAGQPGAVALVVRDGRTVLRKGYGLADLELGVPLRPDMVFEVGSVTKQITAAAILMLQERGKLSVQDEITKHLPDYPAYGPTHGQKITLEHLLAHTSGIPSYTGTAEWLARVRDELTLPQVIDLFKDKPLEFAPGEKWAYSNSGYVLLGAVIEKVSGKTYEDFVEQEIFAPLGMTRSSYGSFSEIVPGRVRGYEGGVRNARAVSMSSYHAAGALLSTADDLALWEQALAGGKLLSQGSLDRMLTPVRVRSGLSTRYGYGWGIWEYGGTRIAEHAGDIFGFLSQVLTVPSERLLVILLSNNPGQGPGPDLLSLRIAAKALGRPLEERRPVALDARTLDDYVGVYRFDETLARVVTREGDRLFAQRTGGQKLPIFPLSAEEFYYEETDTRVRFRRDAGGKVVALAVQPRFGLDAEGAKTAEPLPSERAEIRVDPAVYDAYAGVYELAPGLDLTVTREGDRIFVQPTGQEKVEIFPETRTAFFLKVTDAQIVFADAPATGLVFHQGGRQIPGKRK